MEKRFEFKITIAGIGKDVDSAWTDAVDSFAVDPGIPDVENKLSTIEGHLLDVCRTYKKHILPIRESCIENDEPEYDDQKDDLLENMFAVVYEHYSDLGLL